MVWPKKFGLAQNILGPVEGQGISIKVSICVRKELCVIEKCQETFWIQANLSKTNISCHTKIVLWCATDYKTKCKFDVIFDVMFMYFFFWDYFLRLFSNPIVTHKYKAPYHLPAARLVSCCEKDLPYPFLSEQEIIQNKIFKITFLSRENTAHAMCFLYKMFRKITNLARKWNNLKSSIHLYFFWLHRHFLCRKLNWTIVF